MPVPAGNWRLPQPEVSRTISSTACARLLLNGGPRLAKPPPPPPFGGPLPGGGGGGGAARSSAYRSIRCCRGSLPAACATSSRQDWNTNAWALLHGARIGPVGMHSCMVEVANSRFLTYFAGNSVAARSAL